ncbi:hypothetical protein [Sphingosinithalassobacter sp. CS137]|uniref:hypothetical protein n=1 Tax=Sphingosinithalassobacter sp. CS137 TaxID=2762748 RepID=UPI00165E33BE|nr:hypothetical protein [Sphingosinithalassobacter sp. CS137]
MKRKGITAAVAAWAALAATSAHAQQATQAQCLSRTDVESIALLLAPAALSTARQTCTPVLGETSFLATRGEAMVQRYREAAQLRTPDAVRAILSIANKDGETIPAQFASQPEILTTMLDALVAPALAQEIKPEVCAPLDRALRLLEPLPAENLAGITVMLAELGLAQANRDGEEGDGSPLPFRICPAAAG